MWVRKAWVDWTIRYAVCKVVAIEQSVGLLLEPRSSTIWGLSKVILLKTKLADILKRGGH